MRSCFIQRRGVKKRRIGLKTAQELFKYVYALKTGTA